MGRVSVGAKNLSPLLPRGHRTQASAASGPTRKRLTRGRRYGYYLRLINVSGGIRLACRPPVYSSRFAAGEQESHHEQKNLSTQSTETQTHPRFPRPHENPWRPGGDQCPPRPWPAASFRLSLWRSLADFSFPKYQRLRKSSDYARVYADGRRRHGAGLTLVTLDAGLDRSPRFGVSVHRKIRGACVRNRIKRICREAFRLHRHIFPAGGDMVLTVKPDFACASPTEVVDTVRRLREGKR